MKHAMNMFNHIQEGLSQNTSLMRFSKAWLKSMVPGSIINGFKVCGVYPFNPKVVLDHDPCALPKENIQQKNKTSEQECSVDQRVTLECKGNVDDDAVAEPFSPEEEAFYARRYEEGYNVYDARYVSWIQATHPEDNSQKLLNFFPDVRPLDSVPLVSCNNKDNTPAAADDSERKCVT